MPARINVVGRNQTTTARPDIPASVASPGDPRMFKIEVDSNGAGVVIRLIGRILPEHIDILKSQLAESTGFASFDLKEVTLVDLNVIRFLLLCENDGIRLLHCLPYIREWIDREKQLVQ